ncbi:hypothetical protein LIER_43593 [Lithospermum erythrorhizon]|uniref:Uncharacterized protein n=1 Tax=Lithospermum erythrorhizon TaxID=34254 RepID=A0AAV3QIR1_LITER
MEELREPLPQLRGDTPTISSSIREEKTETYTHTPLVWTSNDLSAAQRNHPEALAPSVTGAAPAAEIVVSL